MRKQALLLCAAALLRTAAAAPAAATLPSWFEPADGAFVAHGASAQLEVTASGATVRTSEGQLSVNLIGAQASASLTGAGALPGRSSYFIGRDRAKWRKSVPQFERVYVTGAYPGIDVQYYFAGRQLEFDFLLAPGADPSRIRLALAGGHGSLNPAGDIVFPNGIALRRPVAYQTIAGKRVPVSAAYRLSGDSASLRLGAYDKRLPLVIDPVLNAGYIGGTGNERANAVHVDANGAVWITGSSASSSYPSVTVPPIQEKPLGNRDVFLAKLTYDDSGKLNLVYWIQVGGGLEDEANAMAFDNQGFVYLTGYSTSTDMPLAGDPLQSNADFDAGTDVTLSLGTQTFLMRLHVSGADDDVFWYNQFYGGTGTDIGNAIAVDTAGNVFVGGYTDSEDLPHIEGQPVMQCCLRGGYESFLIKADTNSSTPLTYATYFGGGSTDVITAMAADADGNVWVAGYTGSEDFPITEGAYRGPRANIDGFLAKIDFRRANLDALLYATTFGGNGLDTPRAIAIDGNSLWVTGDTLSTDFPVTATAHRNVIAGSTDAFLLRLDLLNLNSENAVIYSTYLGGSSGDSAYGLALLPDGRVAVGGYTYSYDFPRLEGTTPTRSTGRGADAFVSVIDPAKPGFDGLAVSTVISGVLVDAATGIAVDANGNLVLAGYTFSRDLPVTDGSAKQSPGGRSQTFVLTVAGPSAPATRQGLRTAIRRIAHQ